MSEETRGRKKTDSERIQAYVPGPIFQLIKKDGESRPKKMSPGAVLAELACKVYGKKKK